MDFLAAMFVGLCLCSYTYEAPAKLYKQNSYFTRVVTRMDTPKSGIRAETGTE